MSLDDFLSQGEARVLWSRFESLVGQQVFGLRVEGDTANVPSSLCSLLSCDLSSPEGMPQFEPSCMQPGHLQRNTNALEIDKQPLYGLPYIAQSTCPLLSLILLNIQELRSLDRYMDPCEAVRRIRDIKRSLIDVHKKALLLESQLHQYINPTLVTTLNRRSAKATFEAELMCKLIDKLRKDSRQSASEPEKRKRVCELTMKLKALLCRQKCEWQCVGRLKETLAIARDMKGVLKFICQLSCLLEHCSDASRRLTERPPPYEYCSPYDSTSKQDSSDALYEDLKLIENQCPPYQPQSSPSQVTISLSLDFTSDREFEGRSHSSDDSSRTKMSSYRCRSRSHSRDYSNVKSDSDAGTLSPRRRTKDCDMKNNSDVGTLSSRRCKKSKRDSTPMEAKSSKDHLKRAKSASSFSERTSSKRSKKHICDSEGKTSISSKSRQQTIVPSSMEASSAMHDSPFYSRTTRSQSPLKSASPRQQMLSKKLAEETINELIGVLEDYIENKSETLQRSGSRSSPTQSLYKSGDVSQSEPTSRQTFQVYSNFIAETPASRPWSRSPPKLPNRLSSTTFSPTVQEHSLMSEAQNDLQDSHTLSRQSFTKDFSSGQSQGWSSATPRKTELKPSLKESRQEQQVFDGSRMSRQDVGDTRLALNDLDVSQPNLNEVKISRNNLQESRLGRQNVPEAQTSLLDFKSGMMSKQIDLANVSKNPQDASQDEKKSGKNSFLETALSKQNLSDARTSSLDFKSSSLNKQHELASMSKHLQNISKDFGQTRLSQGELNSARVSKQDEVRKSRQTVGEGRKSQDKLVQTRISKYDCLRSKENQENFDDSSQIRSSQREMKSTRSNIQSSEGKRKSMDDLSEKVSKRKTDQSQMTENNGSDSRQCKRICDQLRTSRKSLNEKVLDERICKKKSMNEHNLDKIKKSGKDSDMAEISRAQIERQRQLARECADVVRRRIASISPPPSGSRQTQSIKQMCASTSPPRVKRDIEKICSRFEKTGIANSASTDSKNTSELSAHSKKILSKVISPLSVISESKDYQSSNTEMQELEEDGETNNIEDISANRNISDPTSHSPRRIKVSRDRCRHRRTTPPTMSRMSEDCKFYMQPRCNTSDSSGSRDPLLFSSQETDFSYDCDEESDLSCKCSSDFKRRPKAPRHRRTEDKKCPSDAESDLIEDTTTTTDSCAYDDESTSVSPHKSYSGRPQSSRTHHMDDTEGDIDQESDFEDELELKQSSEKVIESEQSARWDRKSSVYPTKSESLHSKRSGSQSSQRSGSINESPPRRMSSSPRSGSINESPPRRMSSSPRPGSINESPPRRMSSSPRPGSGQSRRQSSSRSSYKRSEDRTPSLKQSRHDQHLQQPYMAPGSDRFSASEDLVLADISHLSPYDETDLHASDLGYVKSPALSEQIEQAASFSRSRAGSRRSTGKSGSVNSVVPEKDESQRSIRSSPKLNQSLMQPEHQGSLRASLSGQRFNSGTAQSRQVSNVFSQRQSPLQSPVQGIPTASPAPSSSVRFVSSGASQNSRPPASSRSAHSLHEISAQPHVYQSPEMAQYSSSRPGSPTRMHSHGSLRRSYSAEHGASGVESPPLMYPQRSSPPPGVSRYSGSPAPTYPAGSVHEDPSLMSPSPGIASRGGSNAGSFAATYPPDACPRYLSSVSEQLRMLTPEISQHSSRQARSPASACPGGSMQGYPSAIKEQPQMLTPGVASCGAPNAGSFAATYPAGSVHEYLSAACEQPRMLTPGMAHHSSRQAGVLPPLYCSTVHEDPCKRVGQPQVQQYATAPLPLTAPSFHLPAGCVYPDAAATLVQQQILQLTPGSSQQPAMAAQYSVSYPGDFAEQPQMLQSGPRVLQQSHIIAPSPAPYLRQQLLPQTQRASQQFPMRAQSAVPYQESSRVVEQSQTLQLTPRLSPMRAQSAVPYQESSRAGQQSQTLQSTPRLSPMRAQSAAPYQESSRAGKQSQTFHLTPRLSQQLPMRERSPSRTRSVPSAVLEQPQLLQVNPRECSLSSLRAPSSPHSESSVILEQQQVLQLTPGGSQQSSVRVPSLPSQAAGSVQFNPSTTDQQEVAKDCQMLTPLPDTQEFSGAHLGLQATNCESIQPRQSTVTEMSRHYPYPAEVLESPRRSPVRTPSPVDFTATSRQSPARSDYLCSPRHSPSKSQRPSLTQGSVTTDEDEINAGYFTGDRSRSTLRASIARTSLPRVQISPSPKLVDQNGCEFEEPESIHAFSSISSVRDQNEIERKEKWLLFVPLVILALLVLYYIICYITNAGGCAGCRAPLPNIFFYLINSAVHSVRLIHSMPAPA